MTVQRAVSACLAELNPTTLIVVGVSGGPDSLALLHVLRAVWPSDQLAVAHVNHLLRSTAADEASFVQQTAVAWGLPFYLSEVDVAEAARVERCSLEEAGRVTRYRFFAQVAQRIGATAVAVGHNADDQAETVLMNLLRGSGLAGLRGMQPLSELPYAPDLLLVRPLLTVSRRDIEAYCRAHQLQPRFDASNQDRTFLRNRVRHELLPQLKKYNPQIKTRLQQIAAIVDADYALLDRQVETAWHRVKYTESKGGLRLDRAKWLQLPLSLRRAVLRRAVGKLSAGQRDVGFETIEQARRLAEAPRSGQQATLPGNLALWVEDKWLTVTAVGTDPPTELPQLPTQSALTLPIPGAVALANDWQLTATILHNPNLTHIEQNSDPWQAFIDASDTSFVIRGRVPGERFQPLGMAGKTKSVKELMVDLKIPAYLRTRWPIVATARQLVWIVGHHIDRRARVTNTTHRVIHLQCTRRSKRE